MNADWDRRRRSFVAMTLFKPAASKRAGRVAIGEVDVDTLAGLRWRASNLSADYCIARLIRKAELVQ